MLTIEEIRKKKKEYGYTNEQLASLSGVPLGTVQKILGNTTRSPRMETVIALSKVFEGKDHSGGYYCPEGDLRCLREPENAYQINNSFISMNTHIYERQGTYTVEDYMALPDDQRVELIDGVIYDMAAPTSWHQLIAGEIYSEIRNYIRAKKGPCLPFIAPTDVQLDRDNHTMVQPDVMIVCDRNNVTHQRIIGPPDFVAEVLSPSTKGKDMLIKSAKYEQAGVKEYWLIDPQEENVLVYDFRENENPKIAIFTFEDRIPVLIYDGDLVIDMKEIKDYLETSFSNR